MLAVNEGYLCMPNNWGYNYEQEGELMQELSLREGYFGSSYLFVVALVIGQDVLCYLRLWLFSEGWLLVFIWVFFDNGYGVVLISGSRVYFCEAYIWLAIG